ncbi:ATP-binding protein [Granulicella cerasi]|uniref:histidine kinase n=1 Tax=Granulicella cerasi TaxID=741063 RepID=A0ABW1Z7H2_9BACT|nr:ATP-binding protein [Granulicella cerasi]
MRTFFLQMFVAFWLVTIGIFLVATALNPDGAHGSLENIFAFSQQDAEQVNESVVAIYQHHGCDFPPRIRQYYVLSNTSGQTMCGAALDAKTVELVRDSVRSNHVVGLHHGSEWITATPASLGQQQYVVLHHGPYVPRPWFPHLPGVALPVSLVITFLFAFLLTLPVRALSRAFRDFSAGDLSVRLPVSKGRFSGWGGADVRSLMLDFNYMADRISGLMEAQKMLVRDVSHELRSPLARLRLALEMAREQSGAPLPELDRMEIEAERVNDLIGQMLTLSLMESTQEIASRERIEVRELVESMMPDLRFEAERRQCSVNLRVPTSPLFVDGNAELLRRMVENVARNAIRYTHPGTEVEIALGSESLRQSSKDRAARPSSFVTIEVADRGPGVPEESLAMLFRAFFRTDSARGSSTGGFGLGLSIAERAARLHHGGISAHNRSGGGLRIAIRLRQEAATRSA